MAGLYELLGVLLTSFLLNLIPFAGPSNLLIATNAAALLAEVDPFSIGFLVAFGSASAKLIHYLVTFFLRRFVGEERRKRLDRAAMKVGRWASLALFVAAATPIPDEPVIIPLGLMKYSPTKFFISYFLGKLSIAVLGAYLATVARFWVSREIEVIASITLTVVLTIILLKVDMRKLARRILKRKADQP